MQIGGAAIDGMRRSPAADYVQYIQKPKNYDRGDRPFLTK